MSALRSPLGARLAAALVGVMSAEALAFGTWPVIAVAAGVAALDVPPRHSPYEAVARLVAPASYPLRPARRMRAGAILRALGLGASAVLLAVGVTAGGVALGALVAIDALADAVLGRCASCALVQAVGRRSPVDALGLAGPGPWLVGIGSTGCAPCQLVVDALVDAATVPVVRVQLDERPEAARLVRLVPAVLRVDEAGRVAARLEGPRAPEEVARFVERLDLGSASTRRAREPGAG